MGKKEEGKSMVTPPPTCCNAWTLVSLSIDMASTRTSFTTVPAVLLLLLVVSAGLCLVVVVLLREEEGVVIHFEISIPGEWLIDWLID